MSPHTLVLATTVSDACAAALELGADGEVGEVGGAGVVLHALSVTTRAVTAAPVAAVLRARRIVIDEAPLD
jgi:hypothetical protein